jgi:hypothetical protein
MWIEIVERLDLELNIYIQLSPPPTPLAIGKMMPLPLICFALSSSDYSKREKAGSCTLQDLSPPILFLVLALCKALVTIASETSRA